MDYNIVYLILTTLLIVAGGLFLYSLKVNDQSKELNVNYQNALSALDSIISISDQVDDLTFLKKCLDEVRSIYGSNQIWINYSHNATLILDDKCKGLELDNELLISKVIKSQRELLQLPDKGEKRSNYLLLLPILHNDDVTTIITIKLRDAPSPDQVATAMALANAVWQGMRKKHRNKKIFEHETFLAAATKKGNVGLFDWNLLTDVVIYSSVWVEQLGYQKEQIETHYQEWASRLHADDKERFNKQLAECFTKGAEHFLLEHRLLHQRGHYIWVKAQASIFYDSSGRAVRVMGAHIDISELKAAANQLTKEKDQANKLATRNDTILSTISDGIIEFNIDAQQVYSNKAASQMLGFSSKDMLGKTAVSTWQYAHPMGEICCEDDCDIKMVLRTGEPISGDDWFIRTDDTFIPVHRKIAPILNDGKITGAVMSFYDISKQMEDERSIKLSAAVYENTAEGIMITDSENKIVSVNKGFEEITGYSSSEVIGNAPKVLSSGKTDPFIYDDMWHSLQKKGYWKGEVENRKKNGSVYTELLSITTLIDDFGELYYIGVLNDVSQEKRTQEQLIELANHDRLTGIPNKFFFESIVSHLLSRDKRRNKRSALLYLDMDRFKNINDSMGHDYGDKLIIECASRLNSQVRDMDYCARLGGDEFAIFVDDFETEDEVFALANRLISMISEPYNLHGCTAHVGLSIGVSFYPQDGQSLDELKVASDAALYRAKADGRGVYRTYSTEMSYMAKERHELENLLREAMDNEDLELHYQPQVEMTTGKVVGYEALARWTHPERGVISPVDFIPLAEETGLIIALGQWALDEAASQIREWLDNDMSPGYIAVNISALQLARSDLVTDVKGVVNKYKIPPSSIELEITESFMVHNPQKAADVLHQLKALGVRISIDDFGTGFSSLGYIKNLPFDCIKIDQSFVKGIIDNKSDRSLVTAIIAMSEGLGLDVIAEGVETEEHAELLKRYGCRIAQGWLYGRPEPREELFKQTCLSNAC